MIEDVDGNRFLDFTAGIAVCSTGHCHPRVVQAIQQQAGQLLHMSGTDFYYSPQIRLAEQLAKLAPGSEDKKVFFTNSGTEAVEAAFKLARYVTKRPHMIAFFGAFHGRTMGALSLTSSKSVQRRGFTPLVPHVTHVEFPYPYRYAGDAQACTAASIHQIEQLFQRTVPPDEVAAFVVEPIQGEGGYIVPPLDFHRQLKALAEQHGILYIADEVQSGMGRTGKMFASEHFGVAPDIICTAKGIASGLPLGAIIARSELMQWPPGSHASTFGGNPVACMAALETIALLREELLTNAQQQGAYLQERLQELQLRHASIGDVRGLGLMVGMELVVDRQSKTPAVELCQQLIQRCFARGLLLLSCGRSTIRFCPPLVIDETDIDTAVGIIDEVMRELE
jgi:4-aminobutyrate aminotransferase